MEFVGIEAERTIPADADGLAQLVRDRGPDVKACVEMMSGALWVRDQLLTAGWEAETPTRERCGDRAVGL